MAWSLVLFAFVLFLIGAAVGIPVAAQKVGRVDEAEATVLGASVLAVTLGSLNLIAVVVAAVGGDISAWFILLSLAPIASGALGLWVVGLHASGLLRKQALVLAAILLLVGIPAYFAVLVAIAISLIAAALMLTGLMKRPQATFRALFRALDPRF